MLENQVEKFALELHDALLDLPPGIQTELQGTTEKLLLSPRVKTMKREEFQHVEIPLSPAYLAPGPIRIVA